MRVIELETELQPKGAADDRPARSVMQRPGRPAAPSGKPDRAWFGSTLHRAIVLLMVVGPFLATI